MDIQLGIFSASQNDIATLGLNLNHPSAPFRKCLGGGLGLVAYHAGLYDETFNGKTRFSVCMRTPSLHCIASIYDIIPPRLDFIVAIGNG